MSSIKITAALGLVLFLHFILPGTARPEYVITDQGLVELAVSDGGYLGHAWSVYQQPSCQYPANSGVEHLYLGGIWVGARTASGEVRVSTSAQDAAGIDNANEIREFFGSYLDPIQEWSNILNSPYYHPSALAPQHIESVFWDTFEPEYGDHVSLGLKVTLRALAWSSPSYDDFVILDYTVKNISAETLHDVYVGFFNDTTVGNTNYRSPWGDTYERWIYNDDLNGAWRPGDVPSDPSLWMMHEHDADGDEGLATSWVGCRLLGTEPQVAAPWGVPPVSYNCWSFRGVPDEDDWYYDIADPTTALPGKYQIMSNGHFDVGLTPDADYRVPGNWMAVLSTGPFPTLPPGESVRVTFAMVLGSDEAHLLANSRFAKLLYDYGYEPQVSGVDEEPNRVFSLDSATPNPFNPQTTLSFELAEAGHARLTIFDAAGRLVTTLLDEHRDAGRHEVTWNGRDAAGRISSAGVYLYRLESGGVSETKRMLLVK